MVHRNKGEQLKSFNLWDRTEFESSPFEIERSPESAKPASDMKRNKDILINTHGESSSCCLVKQHFPP